MSLDEPNPSSYLYSKYAFPKLPRTTAIPTWKVPLHLLTTSGHGATIRSFSTTRPRLTAKAKPESLTHLTPSGTAHMVDITRKAPTNRLAVAVGYAIFSNPEPASLIPAALIKKGDVFATARIAGIMAAKQTPSLIPLCHPLALTRVNVDVELITGSTTSDADNRPHGSVKVTATVECHGPTGVEMEALTAVMGGCLTVVDMCKGVDKGISIEGVRVILKKGGRSGEWREVGYAGEGGSEGEDAS